MGLWRGGLHTSVVKRYRLRTFRRQKSALNMLFYKIVFSLHNAALGPTHCRRVLSVAMPICSKRRRHELGANVATFYVIKITTPRTPRVTRIENILRESVQSTVDRLKLHLFLYFKKINLILFNSEHILHIMYITKSQTIRGVIVTL